MLVGELDYEFGKHLKAQLAVRANAQRPNPHAQSSRDGFKKRALSFKPKWFSSSTHTLDTCANSGLHKRSRKNADHRAQQTPPTHGISGQL
jgi:hypothetical protein